MDITQRAVPDLEGKASASANSNGHHGTNGTHDGVTANNGTGHPPRKPAKPKPRPCDDAESARILVEAARSKQAPDAETLKRIPLDWRGGIPTAVAQGPDGLDGWIKAERVRLNDDPGRYEIIAKALVDAVSSTPSEPEFISLSRIPCPFGQEKDPRRLAKAHVRSKHTDPRTLARKIIFYRDEFYEWRNAAYRPLPDKEILAELANTLEQEFDILNQEALKKHRAEKAKAAAEMQVDPASPDTSESKDKPKGPPPKLPVTAKLVNDTRLSLAGEVLLRVQDCESPPAWIGEHPKGWKADEILPTKNAFVHLPSYAQGLLECSIAPTPSLFSTYSLDYGFDRNAKDPIEWLTFLGQLPVTEESRVKLQIWRDGDEVDQESIDMLQEWMGLSLTTDTTFEKIMAMIGPLRSGKGTIARIMKALVGPANVAGPTLSSLASHFGLAPLIGKPVAIIDDARLSGRADQAVITERLLTISGEGTLDVDRKHRSPWTGKLTSRFTIISNELPRLTDSSGALSGRMLVCRFRKSFYGKEDRGLTQVLIDELPGILLWAIEGWKRLTARGYFVQPESGKQLVEEMEYLSSPIGAFLKDCCQVGPGLETESDAAFDAWCDWCWWQNKRHPGEKSTFGRDLRTVIPHLETGQRDKRDYQGNAMKTEDGKRWQVRIFKGIAITNPPHSRPQQGDSATRCNALQSNAAPIAERSREW